MSSKELQFVCGFCGQPFHLGQPWCSLVVFNTNTDATKSDFNCELCWRCYGQVSMAIAQTMQQHLRSEIAEIKAEVTALKIG